MGLANTKARRVFNMFLSVKSAMRSSWKWSFSGEKRNLWLKNGLPDSNTWETLVNKGFRIKEICVFYLPYWEKWIKRTNVDYTAYVWLWIWPNGVFLCERNSIQEYSWTLPCNHAILNLFPLFLLWFTSRTWINYKKRMILYIWNNVYIKTKM